MQLKSIKVGFIARRKFVSSLVLLRYFLIIRVFIDSPTSALMKMNTQGKEELAIRCKIPWVNITIERKDPL